MLIRGQHPAHMTPKSAPVHLSLENSQDVNPLLPKLGYRICLGAIVSEGFVHCAGRSCCQTTNPSIAAERKVNHSREWGRYIR